MQERELHSEELISNELIIEGEYVSEQTMLEEYGWSQYFGCTPSMCALVLVSSDPFGGGLNLDFRCNVVIYWVYISLLITFTDRFAGNEIKKCSPALT